MGYVFCIRRHWCVPRVPSYFWTFMANDVTSGLDKRAATVVVQAFLVSAAMTMAPLAAAQPSAQWKKNLPDFDVFVHTDSISRRTERNGSTTLMVWTMRNFEEQPLIVDAQVIKSLRTRYTIYCQARSSDRQYQIFGYLNAKGEKIGPDKSFFQQPIEPESVEDVLAHKYCNGLAFWR